MEDDHLNWKEEVCVNCGGTKRWITGIDIRKSCDNCEDNCDKNTMKGEQDLFSLIISEEQF
jgi:hypothetical protein